MTQPLHITEEGTFRQEVLHKLMLPLVFWPLMVVVLSVVGVLAYRQAQLRGVPDIGDPFDVEALGYIEIDPAENAYVEYEKAFELLKQHPEPEDFSPFDEIEKTWAEVNPVIREWVENNSVTMSVWYQGTEKPQSLSIQPAQQSMDSPYFPVSDCRTIGRLAEYSAIKAEADGKFDDAWRWHRALIRYSRHVGMYGDNHDRSTGTRLHEIATANVVNWSNTEQLKNSDLLTALAQAQEDFLMTARPTTTIIVEYFVALDELNHLSKKRDQFQRVEEYGISIGEVPKPHLLFVRNEPEFTKRLLQHQVANLLAFAEMSLPDRPQFIPDQPEMLIGQFPYFDAELPGRQFFSAEEFQEAFDQSLIAKFILPESLVIYRNVFREQASQSMLELVLAAQWYRRIHGKFPETLDQLVEEGMIESIPEDPMSYVHEPIRYRRDPENANRATVWSVGENHVDDGGLVEFIPEVGMRDSGFKIGEKVEIVSDAETDLK